MTWGGIGPSGEFKTINHDGSNYASVDYEPARGDVSGVIDNLLVIRIQGRPVSPLTPISGNVLSWDGSVWKPTDINAIVSGVDSSGVGPHDLLSATHPDTIPAAPVDGDLIAANSGWRRFPVGSPGQELRVSESGLPTWQYKPLVIYTSGTGIQLDDLAARVIVNKTPGSPTSINLPASPYFGQEVVVKDGKGDANQNNISITASGTTIDSFSTINLRIRFQAYTFVWNGNGWNII